MTPVLTRRKIIWDDDDPVDIKPLKHTVDRKIEAPISIHTVQTVTEKNIHHEKPGSGNGHKFTASRPLTEDERTTIRKWWLKHGGIVTTNDVVEFRKSQMDNDIGIFQVGGYISVLHRKLARGELKIADIQAYNKNRKARGQSWISVGHTVPDSPHPKFVVIAKEKAKKYHAKYTA
jgi:Ni/Co efflux regulator RcnB